MKTYNLYALVGRPACRRRASANQGERGLKEIVMRAGNGKFGGVDILCEDGRDGRGIDSE